jgi:hypothetical protein
MDLSGEFFSWKKERGSALIPFICFLFSKQKRENKKIKMKQKEKNLYLFLLEIKSIKGGI